jgi:hypothetical protein
LPYTLACYDKAQAGSRPTPNVNREKKREKKSILLPKLGRLATYIGYVSHVSTYLC